MSAYQNDIKAVAALKEKAGNSWSAINPESVARMRAQNRFKTGLDIAKYTADRINNCGVEDIRYDSVFSGPEDENHAGDAVRLAFVEDSWVRNITAVHFHHAAVTISNSTVRCTVQDSACKDMISIVTV